MAERLKRDSVQAAYSEYIKVVVIKERTIDKTILPSGLLMCYAAFYGAGTGDFGARACLSA